MRSRLVLLTSTLLLSACGGAAAVPANPSPTPTVQPPASTESATLHCRLPVAGFPPPSPKGVQGNSGPPSQKGRGGFVDLSSGTYTPTKDSDTSYLAAVNTWLPVPPQAIAPDQHSYVEGKAQAGDSTAPPTTTLYIVDVQTKAKRLLFTAPNGSSALVLAYTAAGVYVETFSSGGPGPSNLVLIDPATGSHHTVPGSQPKSGVYQQVWIAISGDAAWGSAITFPNGQSKPYVVTLVRLDLNTGSTADWYSSGSPFTVAGFDAAGHPILGLLSENFSMHLALVSAPAQSAAIKPVEGTYVQGQGQGFTDTHGTWFGSGDGSLWLYTASGGLEKVASIPPQPGGNGVPGDPHAWRTIAGPCA